MVINHEITIFDFSRFLFATLTFWEVKSRRGSKCTRIPNKEARLLCMLPDPKDPHGVKGCKKRLALRYSWVKWTRIQVKSVASYMLPDPNDPRVAYKGVNNMWP